jgi:predicted XRE-type DNA-binding protein
MNYTKGGFPVWDEAFDREHFTPEEIAESDLRASLITAFVQARKEQGISQRELEALSGVKQPQIARMERGDANPQLDTMIKVLAAMGRTLSVVPLPERT